MRVKKILPRIGGISSGHVEGEKYLDEFRKHRLHCVRCWPSLEEGQDVSVTLLQS